MAVVTSFLSGVLFAIGLGISGMTQPKKITAFLNVLGDWDPSLLAVMLGAVSVYAAARFIVLKRASPVFSPVFLLPPRRSVDRPLILGAILFGLGWGTIGFCPGPAITAAVTGNPSVLIFVLAMATGMYAFEALNARFEARSSADPALGTKTE